MLIAENLPAKVAAKEKLFRKLLLHSKIKKINSRGLMMAVFFEDFAQNKKIIDACIAQGIFTDWFLFAPEALRIAPPLNISEEEIEVACGKIFDVLNRDDL